MNNQEKLTTQSSKSKAPRANLYPVRFSTDILFSSLVSFVFLFLLIYFFEIKNIHCDKHSTLREG